MKIFDTHAHYDDSAFDEDREALLEGKLLEGISIEDEEGNIKKDIYVENITNIGCSIKSSRRSVELAEKYAYMYASIGVIPHHVGDMKEEDIEELKRLAASSKKVVAIGEIGLDYYYDEPARELQHKWLVRQMELA